MSPGTLAGALLQVLFAGVIGWVVSDRALDRIWRDREHEWPERFLAAAVGFLGFSFVLMVVHIASGGAVFGAAPMVPLLALGVLWGLLPRARGPGAVPWGRVAAAAALLACIYAGPALVGGSSVRTGDPPWHLGWTEQLLAGEPVPDGPAPELGRNAYPWGLHAVLATLVRLVPGSTPVVAHEALHLAILALIPLGAACLARRVRDDAGWAAAGATGLIGGFGWLVARAADFEPSPSEARYGADLVAASPNSVYELFPPALPRELALVLLGAAGCFLAASLSARDKRAVVAAGVAVGSIGLVSVPLFVSGLVWTAASIPLVKGMPRLRWIALALGPALAVFALWAGPVVADYVRFGGFVNITPRLGREWPLPVALASWGLLLPLAIAGAWLAYARRGERAVLAFCAATAILLGLAVARGRFGWSLAGNATLLHQGRVWPPAHLLAGALAGVALATAWVWLRRRGRRAAVGTFAVVFAFASASPVLASIEIARIIRARGSGFEYARPDIGPGSFVRRAAEEIGPDDVVDVRGSEELAFYLFQLSGARIARYDDPRLESNDLRIRFADLAVRWDERMHTGGFEADYLILPAPREPVRDAVTAGDFAGRAWVMLRLSG